MPRSVASAGGVGVEAEVEARAEPPQLAELALGQRRAHRRDRSHETGLVKGDDVRVALDHDGPVLLGDRRPRPVEPVDERALAGTARSRAC